MSIPPRCLARDRRPRSAPALPASALRVLRRRRAPALVVTLLGVLGLLGACGGGGDLAAAHGALARGDLERASALVAETEGPAAEELRAAIERAHAARAAVAAETERLLAELDLANGDATTERLKTLRAAQTDPIAADRVAVALSSAADRLAELRSMRGRAWRRERDALDGLAATERLDAAPDSAAKRAPVEGPGGTAGDARSSGRAGASAGASAGADDDAQAAKSVRVAEVTALEAAAAEAAGAVRAAVEAREWSRALALVDATLAGGTLAVGSRGARELSELRGDVLDHASAESVELVSVSARIESERGLADARRYLLAESGRFPREGSAGLVHEELSALEQRARLLGVDLAARSPAPRLADSGARSTGAASTGAGSTGAADPGAGSTGAASTQRDVGAAGASGSAVEQALATAARLGEDAHEAERAGELARARELWLEAGTALSPGARRDRYVGRAEDLAQRLELRAELAAALASGEPGLEELARALAAADGGRAGEGSDGDALDRDAREWRAVPVELLRRAAERLDLSPRAERGLLLERLARGSETEAAAALAALADLVRRGAVSAWEAWGVVARHRGEPVPDGGYVFREGAWLTAAEIERAELLARIETLGARLASADRAERAALREEVVALARRSGEAHERFAAVLAERREATVAALAKGGLLDRLATVAAERRELDRRRDDALDLIFDTEEYFYPYTPPVCPAEKAKLYPAVQRRVDELVAAVRETWDGRRAVSLPAGFRAALEELRWQAELAGALRLELAPAPELPEWLEGVDAGLASLDVATFAWTAAERAELARDRAVRALNAHRWETEEPELDRARASIAEQQQVVLTNDYRRMMGRRALAWNPQIQAAAQWHSDYMANTGNFGHTEPENPDREGPVDRMRMEGYTAGVSENCSAGGAGPEDAHVGWLHSSGHHRNILMRGHREMASALAAYYWTQNFGVGTDFEERLQAWLD